MKRIFFVYLKNQPFTTSPKRIANRRNYSSVFYIISLKKLLKTAIFALVTRLTGPKQTGH